MPYIKPIKPEMLISLANEGHSYRSASRIIKRDCTTIKTYTLKLIPQIHEQFKFNGIKRQSPIYRREMKK